MVLTPEEVRDRRDKLTDNALLIQRLEDEQKAVVSELNDRKKCLTTERKRLSTIIEAGSEERLVECTEYPASTEMVTARCDTGEVLSKRPLTREEHLTYHQGALPFEGAAPAPPPEAPPEAAPIEGQTEPAPPPEAPEVEVEVMPSGPTSPQLTAALDDQLYEWFRGHHGPRRGVSRAQVKAAFPGETWGRLWRALAELTVEGTLAFSYGNTWTLLPAAERADEMTPAEVLSAVRRHVELRAEEPAPQNVSPETTGEALSLPPGRVAVALEQVASLGLLEHLDCQDGDVWYVVRPARPAPQLPPGAPSKAAKAGYKAVQDAGKKRRGKGKAKAPTAETAAE